MKSLERTRLNMAGSRLAGKFYIKRAFRIYPLSICLILLSVLFSVPPNALGPHYRFYGAKWLLANFLLIQNMVGIDLAVSSPLWSLPYEIQMYLILPILFFILEAPKAGTRLISTYWVGALLSLRYPAFTYFPCFFAGVIAYRLLKTVRPCFKAWLWCPAVLVAVVLYVQTPYSDGNWLKNALVCLAIGGLIPLFRENSGILASAAAKIAKYSYGIYLCHTPILWLVYRKWAMPGWERPVWLIIGTGVVSVACYHWIEDPLIRVGARLAEKWPATNRAIAAAA